ncbi:uncharacterized protein LOC121386725 [Gigantopelta aegis]|uniref:uncharacterized protein LOC121386725 n=1 Tax=Gigantopelta aegis TaxID=1735272 RepID=UPI001B88AF42|nr:uncharacterized protein LOC121386725 [Gigantopelta aegis]
MNGFICFFATVNTRWTFAASVGLLVVFVFSVKPVEGYATTSIDCGLHGIQSYISKIVCTIQENDTGRYVRYYRNSRHVVTCNFELHMCITKDGFQTRYKGHVHSATGSYVIIEKFDEEVDGGTWSCQDGDHGVPSNCTKIVGSVVVPLREDSGDHDSGWMPGGVHGGIIAAVIIVVFVLLAFPIACVYNKRRNTEKAERQENVDDGQQSEAGTSSALVLVGMKEEDLGPEDETNPADNEDQEVDVDMLDEADLEDAINVNKPDEVKTLNPANCLDSPQSITSYPNDSDTIGCL